MGKVDHFSKLDDVLERLKERGEGVVVAEEHDDGKMTYLLFEDGVTCYDHYTTGAILHAVNFSCIPDASSRLYVDWEATNKSLYTDNNESKKHAKMIRKFIKTAQSILVDDIGHTRFVSWVVENRTRFVEDTGMWKPSFHIYANVWFPNNYELLPAFVKETMRRANLDNNYVDFGVYKPRSLLRMAGVSSTSTHTLPTVNEDEFEMCHTASMYNVPDITREHLNKLNIEWNESCYGAPSGASIEDQAGLKHRIMELLKTHGETVTGLVRANTKNAYYGSNTSGRNCLTHPGYKHRPGGNRCIVWLDDDGTIKYRCLDHEHKKKVLVLGSF
jgi:hypothetical protein